MDFDLRMASTSRTKRPKEFRPQELYPVPSGMSFGAFRWVRWQNGLEGHSTGSGMVSKPKQQWVYGQFK